MVPIGRPAPSRVIEAIGYKAAFRVVDLQLLYNHADDRELLIDLVFARDDFAFDNLAVEFLHKEFQLVADKAKPNVSVRGAKGFFFVLGQI